jgi:HD-like signal output (HDOD) protein
VTGDSGRSRILFVDDEQSILDGLRDMLRKQRKQWDMVFALGGAAALAEMERGSFDVIVSDMRMPAMDGATLLAKVKDQYPACARIILSGHADRESVVKALPVAHQFLNKPCDGEQLRLVVGRACELQRLMQDESIRSVVGKLDRLPSVPQSYWDLTQAAARPRATIAELTAIVEQDPAMSVKILQLVNSSYFGVAQRLTSVERAVSYLGIDLLRTLALAARVFGAETCTLVPGLSLADIQTHSLLTARLGKQLVREPKLTGDVFTACVIHDVGKIVLAQGIPDLYAAVVADVRRTGRSFHVVERERLALSHAEAGGFLLGCWGLPLSIVEAVAFHHTPSRVQGGDVAVLAAVHIADGLISAAAARGTPAIVELDLEFVERAGFAAELPRWTKLAEALVDTARAS